MYETSAFGIQRNLSAVLAAAIVATGGVILDRTHLAGAPDGIVEVGQPVLVEAPAQITALPVIVVTAKRA